ncbi:uncharacterized protein yc1106_02975 [Curvularia clavata]|uniref:Uncharacterized protein n=1 Tax=Curvularia clavata TaxID=95742 RepID=A0A9Q8Z3R9_CURCL|nr:uncharacterized protein yc1106_02975 [Curvularia clavata]
MRIAWCALLPSALSLRKAPPLTSIGYRIRQFHPQFPKHMTLTHVYVFVDYVSAITFNISAAIVYNGLDTTTSRVCEAIIRLCLLFYTAGKVSISRCCGRYLFLVERVRVLRAPYRSRFGDYLWLLSTITIFVTLGAIGVAGSVSPVTSVSPADRICRIGLQPYAIIPLLVCDIVINMFLTSVFIYLLSPLVRGSQSSDAGFVSRLARAVTSTCRRANPEGTIDLHPTNQVIIRRVEKLLWKTLIGYVLVVLPAAGNLTALLVMRGYMPAFYTAIFANENKIVTWAAVVLHWLTVASADKDKGKPAVADVQFKGSP